MGAVAQGHVLDEFEDRFKRTCGGVNTFEMKAIGAKELHIMEPENFKTVSSPKSKDYHHSAAKKKVLLLALDLVFLPPMAKNGRPLEPCYGPAFIGSKFEIYLLSKSMWVILLPVFQRMDK
jgi:hypothetical protein